MPVPARCVRAILAAAPRCIGALRYVAVEVAASQRAAHPGVVTSVAAIDDARGVLSGMGRAPAGVVIANELLDNLPFALAVFDGAARSPRHDDRRGRDVRGGPVRPVRSRPAGVASGRSPRRPGSPAAAGRRDRRRRLRHRVGRFRLRHRLRTSFDGRTSPSSTGGSGSAPIDDTGAAATISHHPASSTSLST
ncbi:MAG: hypothetical protein WKF58_14865 [Ilumatobacteraceae bacterium]